MREPQLWSLKSGHCSHRKIWKVPLEGPSHHPVLRPWGWITGVRSKNSSYLSAGKMGEQRHPQISAVTVTLHPETSAER